MRGLLTVSPGPAGTGVAAKTHEPGAFNPDCGWRLHPSVAVRPEPFGALLYHFGTRKLSFLKNRTIVEVVNALAEQPRCQVGPAGGRHRRQQQAPYLHALGVLVEVQDVGLQETP